MAILVVAPKREGEIISQALLEQGCEPFHVADIESASITLTQAFFESVVLWVSRNFDPMLLACGIRFNYEPGSPKDQSIPMFLVSAIESDRVRRAVTYRYCATAHMHFNQVHALPALVMKTIRHEPVRPKILFADDNADAQYITQNTLSVYDITPATDGQKAISAFVPDAFDLVLLDFNMPRATGRDVMEHVLEHDQETPILIWSNGMTQELAVELMLAGATDAFLKCSRAELRFRVDRALRTPLSSNQLIL